MTLKNNFFSLLIILAAIVTAWATFWSFTQSTTIPTIKPEIQPDSYMEDIHAVFMNKFGKPSMKIVTPYLVHFNEGDTTHFTLPQLTIYRETPQPWYITAKTAQSTAGMENVLFQDNVVIHHAGDLNSPATVIKTSTLMVHPNKKTAETDQPITMIQPDLTVNAIGMHADMNTGEIKLLSQARGEYAPGT